MNRHAPAARSLSLAAFDAMLDEAPADERWELVGGQLVRMMVGARIEHARIVSNLNGELRQRLRTIGSPCWVLAETFRVETDDASLMPDILVNCTPVATGSTKLRTPSVVMEVLSSGTADRDRGAKWRRIGRSTVCGTTLSYGQCHNLPHNEIRAIIGAKSGLSTRAKSVETRCMA